MHDSWKITGEELSIRHQKEHEILKKQFESKIAMAKLEQQAEIRSDYADRSQELNDKQEQERREVIFGLDEKTTPEKEQEAREFKEELAKWQLELESENKEHTLDDPDKPDPPKGGPQNKSKDKELGKEPDSKSPQGLEKNQVENTPKDLSEAQRRAEAERWIKQQELKRQRERGRGRDSR